MHQVRAVVALQKGAPVEIVTINVPDPGPGEALVKVHIMPATTGEPGGAGELGLPAAVGAVANAYARATGTKPRRFPLIFPVDFTPFTKGTGSTRVQPR